MTPLRSLLAAALAAGLTLTGPAVRAQVEVTELARLDLFSTGYGDTGLPQDLWRGASAALARQVLPRLADRPLSPAARSLAVRILSTGATAPEGAGEDFELAAARARVLRVLGQPQALAVILNRAPNLSQSAALSREAAEGFLFAGDDARACEVARGLASDREGVYWLRLRAYCQAIAGEADAAGLTFSLANQAERDPVYARLMGVVLAGTGAPGAPSYRNGIEIALSRKLGLPSPPEPPNPDIAPPAVLTELIPLLSVASADAGESPFQALFDELAQAPTPAARAAAQGRILILWALGGRLNDDQRGRVAAFDAGRGSATAGALLVLNEAAAAGQKGQTALAALAISTAAPATGITLADRIAIIAALRRVGMASDARAYAIEALAALRGR